MGATSIAQPAVQLAHGAVGEIDHLCKEGSTGTHRIGVDVAAFGIIGDAMGIQDLCNIFIFIFPTIFFSFSFRPLRKCAEGFFAFRRYLLQVIRAT